MIGILITALIIYCIVMSILMWRVLIKLNRPKNHIIINGDVIGGTDPNCYGVVVTGKDTITINGTITGGSAKKKSKIRCSGRNSKKDNIAK
jgi:hypothetical protein